MRTVKRPILALSVTLSDCYGSTDGDPTFVEILARVLYHITINCFVISADGKFHQDTSDYDMFHDALKQFARKLLKLFVRQIQTY